MKTHRFSRCFDCSEEKHCDLLIKMHESVGDVFTDSDVIVKKTDDVDCYSVIGNSDKRFFITCAAIKVWSTDNIRKVITKLYQSHHSMIVDYECENIEVESWDSFSSEFKIRKLAPILEITDPIKVKNSSKIGAWVNSHHEIIITSFTLDILSLNELIFVIAHEKAHIDSSYTQYIFGLINGCAQETDKIINAHRGFRKTFGGLLKVSLVGFGIYTVASQANELSADIQAKLRLRLLGLPDDGGEMFFSRISHCLSLSHPSSDFRRYLLKKI